MPNWGFGRCLWTKKISYLTTFNSPFGCKRFTVIPFGVVFAQEVFHRSVNKKFFDIPGCETDIDDMLVWGRTIDEHDKNLKSVLNRVRKIDMTLNKEKCVLCATEVVYLGETPTTENWRRRQARKEKNQSNPGVHEARIRKRCCVTTRNGKLHCKVHTAYIWHHSASLRAKLEECGISLAGTSRRSLLGPQTTAHDLSPFKWTPHNVGLVQIAQSRPGTSCLRFKGNEWNSSKVCTDWEGATSSCFRLQALSSVPLWQMCNHRDRPQAIGNNFPKTALTNTVMPTEDVSPTVGVWHWSHIQERQQDVPSWLLVQSVSAWNDQRRIHKRHWIRKVNNLMSTWLNER